MAYVQNEQLTPDGIITDFPVANAFEPGTVLINYNGFVFYRYFEDPDNQQLVFDFAPPTGTQISISYYEVGQPFVLNAERYVTPKQLQDKTRISALAGLTAAEIEVYVREAEIAIDAYIGKTLKLYDSTTGGDLIGQVLKFPRLTDDNGIENDLDYVGIPKDITDAAYCVIENLYIQGDPSATTTQPNSNELVAERLGDYNYRKREAKFASEKEFAYNAILGTKAKLILDRYSNQSSRPGEFLIREDVGNVELLNSRQRFQLRNHDY